MKYSKREKECEIKFTIGSKYLVEDLVRKLFKEQGDAIQVF